MCYGVIHLLRVHRGRAQREGTGQHGSSRRGGRMQGIRRGLRWVMLMVRRRRLWLLMLVRRRRRWMRGERRHGAGARRRGGRHFVIERTV